MEKQRTKCLKCQKPFTYEPEGDLRPQKVRCPFCGAERVVQGVEHGKRAVKKPA